MSHSSTPVSVTRLMGLGLTPGKLRGLQRISNPDGTLTMVATDQNSSMINMIKTSLRDKGENREPTYEEIVEAKVLLARSLAPTCSAILVDAYYGYWNSVASFAIPSDIGVLIRVEKSGGDKNRVGAPMGEIEAGWSVEKIKNCGADAVKLLAQFEPTEFESAEHQFQLIQHVYEECQKHDILLLLEPIAFPFGDEKKDSPSFFERKATTVIESAKYISRFCDVYKAEFPGTLGKESDSQLRDNLKALNDACERPWVLLSAGVDFPDYKKQVDMAMECGASGVLGGRAFWKEYFTYGTPEERKKFADTECADRVKQIHDLVTTKGTPWFKFYGLESSDLSAMRAFEGWHARYGSPLGGTAEAGKVDKDAVY